METGRSVQVGRRIRAARALAGKTARELARDIGVSNPTLYRLERGDRLPDVSEIEQIAHATGQDLRYFFGASSSAAGDATYPDPPVAVKDNRSQRGDDRSEQAGQAESIVNGLRERARQAIDETKERT